MGTGGFVLASRWSDRVAGVLVRAVRDVVSRWSDRAGQVVRVVWALCEGPFGVTAAD